jgi:diguanylate cyclase (GGDEF)-like protein/PAS domain S-box-containing protein
VAGDLRALATLQDEIGASTDDVHALLSRVASRAQTLLGGEGVTIDLTQPSGERFRVEVGSARRALDGSARAPERWPGGDPSRTDIDRNRVREPMAGPPASESGPGPGQGGGAASVTVPVATSRYHFGRMTVLAPQPAPMRAEREQLLRLVGRILAIRLEHLEQLRDRETLLTENAIAIGMLRDGESRFRNAFDHSGVGMALIARDGRWLKVNAALGRALGYSPAELLSRDTRSVTHPEDVDLDAADLARLLDGTIQSCEVEKRYLHKTGRLVWGLTTLSAVAGSDGQVLYLICQVQDISTRKEAEEVLRLHAVRDALTGLFNRGELDRLLDEEISRARRHDRSLSLVMVDVDRFKRVNDTCGHQAGDRALQQVADVLSTCVRTHDRVARYGGEEFAVILPETTGADALAVAERMRARVAAEVSVGGRVGDREIHWPVTVSIGIASLRPESGAQDAPAEELFRDADAGLYAAKHAGRNRCVVTGAADRPVSGPSPSPSPAQPATEAAALPTTTSSAP